jgi:hypothetical protein
MICDSASRDILRFIRETLSVQRSSSNVHDSIHSSQINSSELFHQNFQENDPHEHEHEEIDSRNVLPSQVSLQPSPPARVQMQNSDSIDETAHVSSDENDVSPVAISPPRVHTPTAYSVTPLLMQRVVSIARTEAVQAEALVRATEVYSSDAEIPVETEAFLADDLVFTVSAPPLSAEE